MAQKIYDLAVKTGEYQTPDGNTKGRWQNVGAVIKTDDGGKFISLQRWFNPAGIANPENRDNVAIALFEPRQHNNGSQQDQQQQQQEQGPPPGDDQDIPF